MEPPARGADSEAVCTQAGRRIRSIHEAQHIPRDHPSSQRFADEFDYSLHPPHLPGQDRLCGGEEMAGSLQLVPRQSLPEEPHFEGAEEIASNQGSARLSMHRLGTELFDHAANRLSLCNSELRLRPEKVL